VTPLAYVLLQWCLHRRPVPVTAPDHLLTATCRLWIGSATGVTVVKHQLDCRKYCHKKKLNLWNTSSQELLLQLKRPNIVIYRESWASVKEGVGIRNSRSRKGNFCLRVGSRIVSANHPGFTVFTWETHPSLKSEIPKCPPNRNKHHQSGWPRNHQC
jgi:hypothetical protein